LKDWIDFDIYWKNFVLILSLGSVALASTPGLVNIAALWYI